MSLFRKKPPVVLPPTFKIIEELPNIRIIRLKGVIGAQEVVEITGFISVFRAQKDFRFKNLLMDFKDVTYADSSAVARLIQTLSDYKKAHHRMAVIHIQPEVYNLLEIVKVNTLFHFYPEEVEALQDLETHSCE